MALNKKILSKIMYAVINGSSFFEQAEKHGLLCEDKSPDIDAIIKEGDETFTTCTVKNRWEYAKKLSAPKDKKFLKSFKAKTKAESYAVPEVIQVSDETVKTEDVVDDIESLKDQYSKLKEKFRVVDAERYQLQIQKENAKAVYEEKQQSYEMAKTEYVEASKVLNCKKIKLIEKEAECRNIELRMKAVEDQLNSKVIYLVAPGYQATMPVLGTAIYVDNEKIKAEFKIKADFEEYLELYRGHDEDYIMALKFVALINQFDFEEQEFEILVDDDRIKELINVHRIMK